MKYLAVPSILMVVLLGTSSVSAFAEEPLQLITESEAALPSEPAIGLTRNLTRGPGIETLSPAAMKLEGPFRLAVRFKPRNGVPIDPSTVRITYLKQPTIELSPRVKGFVGAEGIDAPLVLVPPGKHVIQIEVRDRDQRVGKTQITLDVGGRS